jgi:hypothetical protein
MGNLSHSLSSECHSVIQRFCLPISFLFKVVGWLQTLVLLYLHFLSSACFIEKERKGKSHVREGRESEQMREREGERGERGGREWLRHREMS